MQKTTFLHKKTALSLLFLLAGLFLYAQPKIQLKQFAGGLSKPVDIAHCGDNRLFVVEQNGFIQILDSAGNKQSVPFLNIDARVNSSGNEQGLLGLAFHPNFLQNGWFFVNYTQNNGDTRVSRFTATPGAVPLVADPDSEKILLEVDQPYSNHNGGCIKFGPDGYLYISLGDGGSGGDPQGNGQKKTTFLGKILRIDVNVADAPYYSVPADNPFVGQSDYLPEIWSLGQRNVWRFSFDRLNGDMWMGDVGQNEWEEVNHEPANTGGMNYGWRCYEGNATYNTSGCQPASAYTDPVFVYNHASANGCSITGGFVYRGTKYPLLYGQYLVADYCSGRFWRLTPNGDGSFTSSILANLVAYEYSSFGENKDGELFVTTLSSGKVMRLDELCSSLNVDAVTTPSCPHENTGSISLNVNGGLAPYTYAWSGGITTASSSNLGGGTYTVLVKDANQCQVLDTIVLESGSPMAVPSINFVSGASVMCNPDTTPVTLSITGIPFLGVTRQWFKEGIAIPGANSVTYTLPALETGTYTVRWKNENTGCFSEYAVPITISYETIPANGIVQVDNVLKLTDEAAFATGYTFQWYLDNAILPGATGAALEVALMGNYTLEVTSANGCKAIYALTVGSNDPRSLIRFVINPNPSNGIFRVEMDLEKAETMQLSVLDQQGKVQYQQTLSGQNVVSNVDIRHLPAGNYTLRVTTGQGQVARKLVKI